MGCCSSTNSESELLIENYFQTLAIRSTSPEDFCFIIRINMKKEVSSEGFNKIADKIFESSQVSNSRLLEKWTGLFDETENKIPLFASLFFLCSKNKESFHKALTSFLEVYSSKELLREDKKVSVSVSFLKQLVSDYIDLVTVHAVAICKELATKKAEFTASFANVFTESALAKEKAKILESYKGSFIDLDEFVSKHYEKLTDDHAIRSSFLDSTVQK